MESIFERVCNKIGIEQIVLFYNDDFSFQLHKTFPWFVEKKLFTDQFVEANGKKELNKYSRLAVDFMNHFKQHLQEQLSVNSTSNYNDQSNAVSSEQIGQFLNKIPGVS